MNVLALDLSTPRAGVALWRSGGTTVERMWEPAPRDSRPLYTAIRELLGGAGLMADDVDLFVAGRGPGNYSGLRIALTVAAMLAMPGRRPWVALDSGVAVAEEAFRRWPVDDVLVAGDARRGRVWCGRCRREDDGAARLDGGWRLVRPGELDSLVPAAGIGVTSEWAALSDLARLSKGSGRWWEDDIPPRPLHLARRAAERWLTGAPFPPAVPVYLHPPVAGV